MSEQHRPFAAEQLACVTTTRSGNVPGNRNPQVHVVPANGNGNIRVLTERMEQAVKLLVELADDVGRIAPEQKHVFDDARAAINEFGMLLTNATDGVSGSVTRIVAPMPGVIVRCEKKAGEHVKKGDIVVVLDAMKVENPIQIPVNGRILTIRCREGERVAKGSVLAVVKQ
jgi:biotin carboxyl carrier protein